MHIQSFHYVPVTSYLVLLFIYLFLLNRNEVYSEVLNVTSIDDELLVLHMGGVQDYVSQNNK